MKSQKVIARTDDGYTLAYSRTRAGKPGVLAILRPDGSPCSFHLAPADPGEISLPMFSLLGRIAGEDAAFQRFQKRTRGGESS